MQENKFGADFDGVFRFSNPSKEDFVFLWNNKEYIFPAESCCPMIIADESLENIQNIRKKAAYKFAVREYYKGKDYEKLVKLGKANPSTFDESVLQPWIDACLSPLPIKRAEVKVSKKEATKLRASKAMGKNDNPNFLFREESANVSPLGEMPDK